MIPLLASSLTSYSLSLLFAHPLASSLLVRVYSIRLPLTDTVTLASPFHHFLFTGLVRVYLMVLLYGLRSPPISPPSLFYLSTRSEQTIRIYSICALFIA